MIPKKRKLKKGYFTNLIVSVLLIGLVAVVVGFLVISNIRIYQERSELKSQINLLEKEAKKLEEQKEELESGLSETQSESFLEKEAREKLGYKKPGEEVTVVLPPAENTPTEKPKSFWEKLLEKLGF